MDSRGYEVIHGKLKEAGIVASISPEPREGEDVEYVTITTGEQLAPAAVLNALGRAGLLSETPMQHALRQNQGGLSYTDVGFNQGPELELRLGQVGSLTFFDLRSS